MSDDENRANLATLAESTNNKTINVNFVWNGKTLAQFTVSGVTLAAILFFLKTVFDLIVEVYDHTHPHTQ